MSSSAIHSKKISVVYRVSQKKYTDFVDPSNKNIAWINPKQFSKHASIANLNIDTLFFDIGALRMKILIFKGQTCFHLETRALAFGPKQILEAQWIKSTKFEDGTTDVFYKIQFMWDLSSKKLRNHTCYSSVKVLPWAQRAFDIVESRERRRRGRGNAYCFENRWSMRRLKTRSNTLEAKQNAGMLKSCGQI